jgi:hypothetical protein
MFGSLFPTVGVGVGPPRRGVTIGFTMGMEGSVTGRSRRPRRPRSLDGSMSKLSLGFEKCLTRSGRTPCISEVPPENPKRWKANGLENGTKVREKERGC